MNHHPAEGEARSPLQLDEMYVVSILTSDVLSSAPQVLDPLVRRPRLEALLAEGTRRRVTLVCAQPGAGKTTMLAAWFGELDARRARWVTASADDQDVVDGALGDATEGELDLLVVDDAHHLPGPALARLACLLAELPSSLDVVLAARADPPIALSALRLQAKVREIRNADLAFTQAEAATILNQGGARVPSTDVARLHARAEGWAAGLRLMQCALERGATAESLATDDSAAQAAVSDYLLEEVLEREPPEVRQFLLRTSIADRLTPELAVLLSDDPRGGTLLDDLHRRGVFVTAIGEGWYRYHSLFATLLRARLRVEDPMLGRQLHRSAASWFASQGLAAPAERHARAGEDWHLLGDLVRRRWHDRVLEGAFDDPLVADPLPSAALEAEPALALLAGSGPVGPTGGAAGELADEATVISRLGAVGDGDLDDITPHRCRDAALRPVVAVLDAELALLRGELMAAAAGGLALDEAAPWVRADGKAIAALAMALQGDSERGARLADEVASTAPPAGRVARPLLVLTLAVADAQRGRPFDRSQLEPLVAHPAWGVRACARAILLCRTPEQGVQGLDTSLAGQPLVGAVLVALGALDVVDSTGGRVAVGGDAEQAVLQARRAFASGAPKAAAAAAATLAGAVHPRTASEAAVLQVASAEDGDAAALAAVVRALPSSAWAPFVSHAASIGPHVERLARIAGPYQSVAIEVHELLGARSGGAIDALTEREQTVLELLPTLMSNEEIAAVLRLSVNTVKTHLKALYRKLGVERRRDAVVRARELGVL